MRTPILWLLGLLLASGAPALAAEPAVTTDEQKTLYALGLRLGQNLTSFGLTAAELELVQMGVADAVLNRPAKADLSTFMPKIQELQKQRLSAQATVEKKAGQAFLDKAAAEKGATRTPSGLIVSVLKPGTGAAPKSSDSVKVHYHGTLPDGTVFDSSVQRGEPATFPLSGVIPCFSEGILLMKVGGKGRLVCPSDLAYGDRGQPPRIKPGATLVFEVELLEIVK